MYNYDVVVVGGGFTGVAAAIAAAREGLDTIIIESAGALGGAATNCLVNPFMDYHMSVTENGEKKSVAINVGIFAEIRKRLAECGGMESAESWAFDEEKLKVVLDDMCAENGVRVLFHATLCGADCRDGKIESIEAITKAGRLAFAAKTYIDCSGDADLAFMCGFPTRLGRDEDNLCQPMTLCFRVANVKDTDAFLKKEMPRLQTLYKEARESGRINNPRENILVFWSMAQGVIHFNSTRIVKRNPTDPFDVSIAEAEARKQAYELFDFIKENSTYFENARLVSTAASIGVRESRMIDGEYLLNEDDILSCREFTDSIACGNYCIDIHSPDGTGTTIKHIPEGKCYHIPYRCLVPLGSRNLVVAGRTISTTHVAQSAYRIMPIVCCIGEGAGTAAAVAIKDGCEVRSADIGKIHAILDKNGAKY